jgi:hypothetical protein
MRKLRLRRVPAIWLNQEVLTAARNRSQECRNDTVQYSLSKMLARTSV